MANIIKGIIDYIIPSGITAHSAIVSFKTSGWRFEPTEDSKTGDEKNGSETKHSYTGPFYLWYPSGANNNSGTYEFTELAAGSGQSLTMTVEVSYIETTSIHKWHTEIKDEEEILIDDGTEMNDQKYSDSINKSVQVYTKPERWTWGFAVGEIIGAYNPDGQLLGTLTAAKQNSWCDQCGIFNSWKQQKDLYHNYDFLKVNPGDLVSADIYNAMAVACGAPQLQKNEQGYWPIISIELFEILQQKVN